MSTKREQILTAAKDALTGITDVPDASVYRSRVVPLARNESPAIVIEPVQDQADRPTVARIQWALTFQVSVIVRSDTPDLSADAIVKEVHNKLMSDSALLSLLTDLAPVGVSWTFSEADTTACVVSMQFVAGYQTNALDIST